MDFWPHPLSREEPEHETPQAVPPVMVAALATVRPPALLFDLTELRRCLDSFVRTFDQYYYPLKTNPLLPLAMEAVSAGSGMDVCSQAELDLALQAGTDPAKISFSGLSTSPELLSRLARIGARVNLESLDQISCWLKVAPGKPVGVRLAMDYGPRGYGDKFGLDRNEIRIALECLKSADTRLAGLHVHGWNGATAPEHFADAYKVVSDHIDLLGPSIRGLDYLNLGGGWGYDHATGIGLEPTPVRESMDSTLLAWLREHDFKGEICVEAGERVLASCGYWLTSVVVIKSRQPDHFLVVTDTPTPIPSAALPYPVTAFHQHGRRWQEIASAKRKKASIRGITNSPFDVIRRAVALPQLVPGDRLLFHRTGAYLPVLFGGFNGYPIPATHFFHPDPEPKQEKGNDN